MKKIIWVLVVLFFCFLWYSHGLYSDQCSWWKVYRAEWVCWSCRSCDWIMYWGTRTIGCDVMWYKKCCESPWVLYKNDTKCCQWTVYKNDTKCCEVWRVVVAINGDEQCKSCASLTAEDVAALWEGASACNQQCAPEKQYPIANWLTWCCPVVVENWECDTSLQDIWINIDRDCLLWHDQCSLNVYKVLWIRKSNPNPTVWWFFQDIVLAATTFVWTLIVVALVFSGLLFSFWSISWKDTKRAKTIMMDSFVWLLMVMGSYTIIRLIQFLATAWS